MASAAMRANMRVRGSIRINLCMDKKMPEQRRKRNHMLPPPGELASAIAA